MLAVVGLGGPALTVVGPCWLVSAVGRGSALGGDAWVGSKTGPTGSSESEKGSE